MNGEIPLVLVGCDFRVASSRWRSRISMTDEEAAQLGKDLVGGGWADGLMVLDTCNRNEWLVSTEAPGWTAELLRGQMLKRLGPEGSQEAQPYIFTGKDAARHLLRVAIGQESLVTGERQIASQLNLAMAGARNRKTSSRVLNGLGSIAGRLVRTALRQGLLGGSSTGVHCLAMTCLHRKLLGDSFFPPDPALPLRRVAVVGMGSIGRRLASVISENSRFQLVRVNRTVAPDSGVQPLADLPRILATCDAAIFCTAARQPILHPEMLLDLPQDKPLLLIDIGIPEQVQRGGGPGTAAYASNIDLVGLDELTAMFRRDPLNAPEHQADEIEALVAEATEEFVRYCALPPYASILDVLRRTHRQITSETIPNLLNERLPDLPPRERAELEAALKAILVDYTAEVFQTVRDATLENAE